jgi:hypothetical protein
MTYHFRKCECLGTGSAEYNGESGYIECNKDCLYGEKVGNQKFRPNKCKCQGLIEKSNDPNFELHLNEEVERNLGERNISNLIALAGKS